MLNKTKFALAAALILSSGSVALAQTHHSARSHHRSVITGPFQTRDVGLPTLQSRDVYMRTEPAPTPAEENWMDRASQNYDGGGY